MDEANGTRHVVIGSAGHIDHGKTALIKALTGRDLDRLGEEKRRGITIEIGFAFYGDRAAFVDVPGHERLVKTMIAGASAMSAALLVIAADDGPMPQTFEHLTVLEALAVSRGVVAVSKADLVDGEWLELVVEEVRNLLAGTSLAGSPVVAVDSVSGRGIDELKRELDRLIKQTTAPREDDFFRLPIDRSFIIRGHGRVVTGTVWNGSARAGDTFQLEPGGKSVRVRGLQAHERPVDEVRAGDRAALNLASDLEPERGQMLVIAGRGVVTRFIDAAVFLARGARTLRHRARVRVHLGTAEVIGRLLLVGQDRLGAGERAHLRITLEAPLVAMHGDLGVIRFYSPVETLGGLRVLDPDPPDRRRTIRGLRERLAALAGSTHDVIGALARARTALAFAQLARIHPAPVRVLRAETDALRDEHALRVIDPPGLLVDPEAWARWRELAVAAVAEHHRRHPNEPGMPRRSWAQAVFARHAREELAGALLDELSGENRLVETGGTLRLPEFQTELPDADRDDAERVYELLVEGGFNPPVPSVLAERAGLSETRVRALLRALKNVGRAVILDEKVVLAERVARDATEALRAAFPDRPFRLTEATSALDTSRKVGVPLLEYLDKQGVTVREGDVRRFT
ncbi:MAG: Selenocysteine-specific elongation factor [Calditrichaeota bacterium]|nr:Selenocysteine-specific elongation factor [Calditrichota bacterium]